MYFYAADNQTLGPEKMSKINHLYEILNNSLLMFAVLHEYLSKDDCMISYFGRRLCNAIMLKLSEPRQNHYHVIPFLFLRKSGQIIENTIERAVQ